MRFAFPVLTVFLASCAVGGTNDLAVARQALRDGFWSLAREHAAAACAAAGTNSCVEARRVILESWVSEGKWDEVLQTESGWGNPAGDVFLYYRALALAKKGETGLARAVFAVGFPEDPVYRRLATRLIAGIALDEGRPAEAVETLLKASDPEADDRILLAEAKSRLGKGKDAAALWREVLADTNASLRAVATAAANVGDEVRLRALASNAIPAEVRSLVTLRLGCILLNRPETFGEGAGLIRIVATRTPDADGALEASRTLAAARLRRGDWADAVKAYNEILEIWPAAARIESVQEGLGWALLKQGKPEEALQTFRRAEACAATDEERAFAAVKVGDALVALGRVDEATAVCREILAKGPKADIAKRLEATVRLRELELKGRQLYREFRFAEAQKVFAEVGAGDETRRGRMSFFEILCLYGQGRDGEAETRARTLVAETTDPRLKADLTQWLARSAYNAGRWREAKDLFMSFATSPLTVPGEAAASRIWAARAALAANDFTAAIKLLAEVVSGSVSPTTLAEALIVQGEALIELARFDEAVIVFERAASLAEIPPKIRLDAQVFRADALYAMGADNPARYEEALAAYRQISQSESVSEAMILSLAYKTGLALEKLKRRNEAIDQYYTHVVLAYREARRKGRSLGEETRAVFARAAFRLADLCEASGHFSQAEKTLELVAASDVPAAAEAEKRIERLRTKGVLP